MPNEVAAEVDTAQVAAQLRIAMMKMVRRIKRETGGAESPSAISALAAIRRLGTPTLGELAEAEGISRPSMSAQAASLERRGLVAREGSEADRRLVRLRLTAAGERAFERSRTQRTAWLARRLKALRPEEVLTLEAAARLLDRLLAEDA